jgi:hypothetical protein
MTYPPSCIPPDPGRESVTSLLFVLSHGTEAC